LISKTLVSSSIFWHPLILDMYKSLEVQSLTEIVILEQSWKERIADLRLWSLNDRLVCPGCRQPVRLKAGSFKRWHFAHKHLQNCPLSHQSPTLLTARAIIYDWIKEKSFQSPSTIEIEKYYPGLPRPIDILINSEHKQIAFWIIDTRLTPVIRNQIKETLAKNVTYFHWIFTSNMLREDPVHPGWVHLTTTEREFLQPSSLDNLAEVAGEQAGFSVHYLDPVRSWLVTFRRLHLQHPPQRYSGRKLENPLDQVKILVETGEFIHPTEITWLEMYQQKAFAAQRRLSKQKQIDANFSKEKYVLPLDNQIAYRQPFQRQAVCRICGKTTTDWVSFSGKTGACLCRECSSKGYS
jgi:Competence protein CoiA-like family